MLRLLTLLLLIAASVGMCPAQTLDQYGGLLNVTSPNTNTGYFRLEQFSLSGSTDKRWLWVDPLNHPYYNFAMIGVTANNDTWRGSTWAARAITKYGGTDESRMGYQIQRLQTIKYNGLGTGSSAYAWPTDASQSTKMPFLVLIRPCRYAFEDNVQLHYLTDSVKNIFNAVNTTYYTGYLSRNGVCDYYDANLGIWADDDLNPATTTDQLMTTFYAASAANQKYATSIGTDDGDQGFGFGAGPDFSTPISSGHYATNLGWFVAATSPLQTAENYNYHQLYNRYTVYSKAAWSNFLCGVTCGAPIDQTTGVSCTVTSNANVCTVGSSHPYYANEAISAQSCTTGSFNSTAGTAINITSTTSTTITFPLTHANGTSTGCTILAGPNYSTIGAFNSANGSSYTTFSSSGTTHTSVAMSGSGTGPYTATLSTTVSKFSLAIRVGATVVCGDPDGSGALYAPTQATYCINGTINFATGALSINLNTTPGSSPVVDYVNNGWAAGGTGLLDEDGHNTSWMGNAASCSGVNCNYLNLTGVNATLTTNMNNFYRQITSFYFKTMRSKVTAYLPNYLYTGMDTLGSYDTPSSKYVLQGAAPFLDAMEVGSVGGGGCNIGGCPSSGYTQTMLDYVFANFGNKPYWSVEFRTANADSEYNAFASSTPNDFTTQALRATDYYNTVTTKHLLDKSNGVYPVIGVTWNAYLDEPAGEADNWGIVSLMDNSYDGHESVTTFPVTCSAPIAAFQCGNANRNDSDGTTNIGAAHSFMYNYIQTQLTLSATAGTTFSKGSNMSKGTSAH